jgi:hypothetical protein
MASKRKREGISGLQNGNVSFRPTPGTKTFHSGKDVKQGLALGTKQGMSYHLSYDLPHAERLSHCRISSTNSHSTFGATFVNQSSDYGLTAALSRRFSNLGRDIQCLA